MGIEKLHVYRITCQTCQKHCDTFAAFTPHTSKFDGRWVIISTTEWSARSNNETRTLCYNCYKRFPVAKFKAIESNWVNIHEISD